MKKNPHHIPLFWCRFRNRLLKSSGQSCDLSDPWWKVLEKPAGLVWSMAPGTADMQG